MIKQKTVLVISLLLFFTITKAQQDPKLYNCEMYGVVLETFRESNYEKNKEHFKNTPPRDFECDSITPNDYSEIMNKNEKALSYLNKWKKSDKQKLEELDNLYKINPYDLTPAKFYSEEGDYYFKREDFKRAKKYYNKAINSISYNDKLKSITQRKINDAEIKYNKQSKSERLAKEKERERRFRRRLKAGVSVGTGSGYMSLSSINGKEIKFIEKNKRLIGNSVGINLLYHNSYRAINFQSKILFTKINMFESVGNNISSVNYIDINPNLLINFGGEFNINVGGSYMYFLKGKVKDQFHGILIDDREVFNNLMTADFGISFFIESSFEASLIYKRGINDLFKSNHNTTLDGESVNLFPNLKSKINLFTFKIAYNF